MFVWVWVRVGVLSERMPRCHASLYLVSIAHLQTERGAGLTDHPSANSPSFVGSHSSLVKPLARESVSTGVVLTTTGMQGIWWNSGAARLQCCRSTYCVASADYLVDVPCESYGRAVGRGCGSLRVPCRDQIWITTSVYTFAPAWGLVVPGRFDIFLPLFRPYNTVVFLRRSAEMAVFVFVLAD